LFRDLCGKTLKSHLEGEDLFVMRKLATALSLCMALGTVAPAFADSDAGLDHAVDGSLIVTRVLGMGAGLVIGTPIAVGRETTKSFINITSGAADKVGGHDFMPSCLLATFFSVPAALVVGPVKGVIAGGKNGLNGFNTPFAQDSFSMGSLNEE
jgi:hypothetical protein